MKLRMLEREKLEKALGIPTSAELTEKFVEEQAEVIQKALHKMKQNDIEKNLNSNINGNALFQICKEYNER